MSDRDLEYLLRQLERRVRQLEAGWIPSDRMRLGTGSGDRVSVEFITGAYRGADFQPDTDSDGTPRWPVAPAIMANAASGGSSILSLINAGGDSPLGGSEWIGEADVVLDGALSQATFQILTVDSAAPIAVDTSPIVLSLRGLLLSAAALTWNQSQDSFTLSTAPLKGPLTLHLARRRRT